MVDLRRVLLLSLLATAGCGPTSDWPLQGEEKDDETSTPRDAGVPSMDAGVKIDAGSSDCDGSDAGDAGADAACDIVIID